MKYLYIAILLSYTSFLIAEEKTIEPEYNKLLEICNAHSDFRPSSISFFETENAKKYENEYYQIIKELHSYEGMEFLLSKLKSVKSDSEKTCVKGMLNTWPG